MNRVRQLAVLAGIWTAFAKPLALPAETAILAPATSFHDSPMRRIELGDQVKIEVFDNEDLSTTTYVGQDGSIRLPLAGNVKVAGASPDQAAKNIETALKSGKILIDPHVTVTLSESYRPFVSVSGEVARPGRYEIGSTHTVLDAIAMAGGIGEKGSDRIYLLRTDESGKAQQLLLHLDLDQDRSRPGNGQPEVMQVLRAGDSVYVPKATFTITGEVTSPGEYRIETGMVLFQAIARAGGVTPLGSASRVEIRRRGADDKFEDVKAKRDTRIEAGDVIRVKERIF